jgi:hypothetical protein
VTRKFIIVALMVCFFFGLLAGLASAQVVRLTVNGEENGQPFEGYATATCIGHTDYGSGVFLTAGHNFRDAHRGYIQTGGRWRKIDRVNEHPSADVATFEVSDCQSVPAIELAESEQIGGTVCIPGFGPEYQGGSAGEFCGQLGTDLIQGFGGLHPVQGDSGAPAIQGGRVVAVVVGHETYSQTRARSDNAEAQLGTVYVPLRTVRECLNRVYQQCPPSGCKIWIRREVRQPVGFLGLPYGPPQVVGVAEPVPQTFVPEQSQRPVPRPDPISVQGPPGSPGPQGPPGRDGRSVTQSEVESIVNAWLDANRDSLRGPAGPQGPAGSGVSVAQFESRLTTLEQRPFRIILSSDGKIVDDETYKPGEPVVLDLKRLRSVSDAK